MWSDRKPENLSSQKSPRREESGDGGFEGVGRVSHVTVIGRSMTIRGAIRSEESLHIEGELDGKLEMADHRLTVGTYGRVNADTQAREVEILGTLNGDIDAAKKISIRKGGRLIGDLRTPAIVIEDGAYFKGRIEIVTPEQRPQVVNTEQRQPTATSEQRPQIVRNQVNGRKTAAGA